MKKTIIYIISFFLFLAPNTCLANNSNSYAIDDANILKTATKDYINIYSEYLDENLNIEYYLVTVKELEEDKTLKEYSDYIFEKSNLTENSILIVVSKNNREIRVKVGTELSAIINDEIINEYLNDYFLPYLKTDDWNTGIKNGYSSFFKLICNSYEIDTEVIEVYDGNNFINKNKNYIILAIVWLTSIFSYIYCNYLKEKLNHNIGIKDNFIIIVCLILNILLFIITYFVLPISLLIVLLSEIILVINDLPQRKKIKHKAKRKRGKKNEFNKKKS